MNDLDALITSSLRDEIQSPRRSADEALEALGERIARYNDPIDSFLKKEVPVPAGVFEAIEESLMSRIGSPETAGLRRRQPRSGIVPQGPAALVWPVFTIFPDVLKSKPRIAALFCATAVLCALSFFALKTGIASDEIVTRITRAFGSDFTADFNNRFSAGSEIVSHKNGGLTIRNSGGQVSLFDNATLTIGSATRRNIEYRIFTAPERRSGRIEFLVSKRARGERYVVVTPWYDIHVVGTRFVLEQERSGALKTILREGTIRIVSPRFNEILLHKGDVFRMDAGGIAWRTETASDTVTRSDEDRSFVLSQDSSCCRLVVTSRPAHADVFINGTYQGITPFAMLGRKGTYTLSVRSGSRTRDTVIILGNEAVSIAMSLDSTARGAAAAGTTVAVAQDTPTLQLHEIARTTVPARPAAAPPAGAPENPVEKVRKLLDSAQKNESAGWQNALSIYERLAADHTVPPLYRQTALFSHGRLTAEKQKDTAAALKDFGTYCILYPDGTFISEALLRLSELELTKNPTGAVEYFCRFLALNPHHPRRADAAYHMGLLLQQRNNYTEAVRMYTMALKLLGSEASDRRQEILQMIVSAQAAQQPTGSEQGAKPATR